MVQRAGRRGTSSCVRSRPQHPVENGFCFVLNMKDVMSGRDCSELGGSGVNKRQERKIGRGGDLTPISIVYHLECIFQGENTPGHSQASPETHI